MDILLQESAEDAWWWVNASRMEMACILAVMAAILVGGGKNPGYFWSRARRVNSFSLRA